MGGRLPITGWRCKRPWRNAPSRFRSRQRHKQYAVGRGRSGFRAEESSPIRNRRLETGRGSRGFRDTNEEGEKRLPFFIACVSVVILADDFMLLLKQAWSDDNCRRLDCRFVVRRGRRAWIGAGERHKPKIGCCVVGCKGHLGGRHMRWTGRPVLVLPPNSPSPYFLSNFSATELMQ